MVAVDLLCHISGHKVIDKTLLEVWFSMLTGVFNENELNKQLFTASDEPFICWFISCSK